MAVKQVVNFLCGAKYLKTRLYHCAKESHEELLPAEWYEKAFQKITKLSRMLKNVDSIDGKLVDVRDDSIIIDDRVEQKMQTFKSLARVFIGSPSVQQKLKNNMVKFSAGRNSSPFVCFTKQSERESMNLSSLTTVSNFLSISAQQRKLVRTTVCSQVTEHRIWTGTLVEVLNDLKPKLDYLDDQYPSKRTKMGQQIISHCLKLLYESAISDDLDSNSWMCLSPPKVVESSSSQTWEDVREMFNDLIECLKTEDMLLDHVTKLEIMKEGLSQIKDVLIDKNIGYKEAKHQESLVKKKLSKTLGFSSRCLFTLLLYYLYGHVGDIEVDICGGIYNGGDEKRYCLCLGRIVSSDEEKMVWRGVRHLDRAIGLFKFVWETAGMKGELELQGHVWCVGADSRMLTYKGNVFFIHEISL
ncbi:hypothetical protein UlMin_033450 [Ulmus minor]